MSGLDHQWATRVLSGEERGIGAASLRAITAVIEPFYSLAMIARNAAYDRRLFQTHSLGQPTISVGNLTTGGTGKTPVVRWLCEQFISRGLRPAVLLRGYRGEETSGSDEAKVLAEALGDRAIVIANGDRVAGARSAMAAPHSPDVFVLDDAFQHRRAVRDFDLVLIDATEPFGYGHVLPRGLMREPMRALRRASAIVVTRSDQVSPQQLVKLEEHLRHSCPTAPIYAARHANTRLLTTISSATTPVESPISELSQQPFFAFAGIANPQSLRKQLDVFGNNCAGFRAFPDHHAYTNEDLAALQREAHAAGAAMLLTTEKDWVKIRSIAETTVGLPISRLDLRIEFRAGDEERLFGQVMERFERRRAGVTAVPPGPLSA